MRDVQARIGGEYFMVQKETEGIHYHCFTPITPLLDRDPNNGYMPTGEPANSFEMGASGGEANKTAALLLNDKPGEQFPTAIVFSIENADGLEHSVCAATREELQKIQDAVG